MLHATPLFVLCLTLSELQTELSGLPPYREAYQCYEAASRYVGDLQRWSAHADTYGEQILLMQVLGEASPLLNWWSRAADAMNPDYGWACRLEYARTARQIHDWNHHGYPPCLPFWRLPHASALALPKRLP